MADREIARFIQHYERLTRRILLEMPAYADLVVRLDRKRRPTEIEAKANRADAPVHIGISRGGALHGRAS